MYRRMKRKYLESYKAAGVDIDAGYRAVELMKDSAARTMSEHVLGSLGAGNGLYDLAGCGSDPVMVSAADAVGTKLKIAFMLDRHETVGIDCVAMCVNDLLCCGARPLFFLDYLALGKTIPEKAGSIVAGVAEGCVQAGCALIGGKTAEMPGFYGEEQYDLAGVSVGVVEREHLIDGSTVQKGDVILGLASSGIHANGYSLVRKVFDIEEKGLEGYATVLGRPLGDVLLDASRIYVKPVLQLLKEVPVKSLSHITKGGLYEHLPRSLPEGLTGKLELAAIRPQPIFQLIQRVGNIPQKDMFATFNMGVGMTLVVRPEDADTAMQILRRAGEKVSVIGEVVEGDELLLK